MFFMGHSVYLTVVQTSVKYKKVGHWYKYKKNKYFVD